MADTDDFVEAYLAGDDDRLTRALYAPTRMHWERIEPVAESRGPRSQLDLRGGPRRGRDWTGWHRIEKDLWPPVDYRPMSPAQRQKISKLLVADTATLLSGSRIRLIGPTSSATAPRNCSTRWRRAR